MSRKVRTEQDKASLMNALADVRGRILAEAEALPDDARHRPFVGTWDAGALLAHLIGWDHTNRAAIGEVLNGALPEFYAHHDRDWTDYNAMLVARHKKDDFAALLEDVAASHAALLAAIGQVRAEEIDRDRGIRFRGWKVTIARLLEAERSDEEEHWRQLHAFAATLDPAA